MKNLPDIFKRREVKTNQQFCPKCKSTNVESFYCSYNPKVLVCNDCGYEWELPFPPYLERQRRKFLKLMRGNFDLGEETEEE